ncbi:hypothetical protein GQ600_26334 [Phytophthora cactorum]|nr:hypothetical protein GQ600_26334 [Phytophthora cactorum]
MSSSVRVPPLLFCCPSPVSGCTGHKR